ncbi:hypothetical protein [Lentilactobacillus hilgardii]|jgi:hypothetical protein|uniref:Uncharacterized protein n=1 Tax=Lentilactobacillus hilgardii TaxID=1588 RepID=A0A6P1E445_LENHI|nr:hypothetical protein [Lentilactobacillus hilgardii]EEI71654.1 hypothetical protein HMPREF0496_1073 [Lentilactobacillus hilgardii ATCC 27305]MCT3392874.1 hypothetical protein [Lentilactobacillus hilgardii]QHB51438.1 hypothetical protein GQR93_04000 [Lentilactobacillus hilgardii]RRG08906.1 MAG: hypothetical protein DUD35_10865 [Lactobacillus sp.]
MNEEERFEKMLQDKDYKYFDSLLKKALTNHDDHFSFSTQHFDNHQEAQSTLCQWADQHQEVNGFEIGPVDITVHLHTTV